MVTFFATLLLMISSASEQEATYFFPLTKGHTINYTVEKQRVYELPGQTKKQTIMGSSKYEFIGETAKFSKFPNVQTLRINMTESNQDTGDTIENSMEMYLSSNGDSILWHGQKTIDSILGSGKSEIYDPPTELLNAAKALRNEPFNTNSPFQGMVIKEEMKSAEVIDSFETPIGKFSNVLKVKMAGTISGIIPEQNIEIIEGEIEETLWFVPKIGLARSEENLRQKMKLPNGIVINATVKKVRIIESYKD